MDTKIANDRAAFWDQVYSNKSEDQVSWYQENPEPSLSLIRSAASDHGAPIIDVGGGASRLVDSLLAGGYTDITVLDVSAVALERVKERLGPRAASLSCVAADVTGWTPPRQWQVWHDRAVFHFLTDRDDQDAYIAVLKQATMKGSVVIIAAFAPTGPERCSGLPVQRYSAETLATRLGTQFRLTGHRAQSHSTPFATTQEFTFAVFQRE